MGKINAARRPVGACFSLFHLMRVCLPQCRARPPSSLALISPRVCAATFSANCVPCAGRARSEPNESDDDDHDDEAGAAAPRIAAAAPGAAAQITVDDDAAAPVIAPNLPVQGAAADVARGAERPPPPSRRSCIRRRFAATPVAVVNLGPPFCHFMHLSTPTTPQCRIWPWPPKRSMRGTIAVHARSILKSVDDVMAIDADVIPHR